MRTSKAGYSCRESSMTAHMQLLQTTKQANCITHAKIAIENKNTPGHPTTQALPDVFRS